MDVYRVREFEFNPIIEPHKRKGYFFEKQVDYDFFETFPESSNELTDSNQETESPCAMSTNSKKRRIGGKSLSSSVWNCDGEVINEAAIHVKVHCQLVTMFAAGYDVDRLLADHERRTKVRFQ